VKELPLALQPRERFAREGAEKVGVDVLLAILLRSGTRGVNVLELARRLVEHYATLTELAQATVEDLAAFKGVGLVKAQMLKAALELARRIALESVANQPVLTGPDSVSRLLTESSRILDCEVFWVLLLDTRNRLLRNPEEVSRGLLNASLVHPREVFRNAIRMAAAAVIVAHNHPSGDPSPSAEDLSVTRQLVEAGQIVGIPVLDHVIVGRKSENGTGYFSLRESGLVNFDAKYKR
jgi:DNA repair protein RadC